jgi:cysteate synthase
MEAGSKRQDAGYVLECPVCRRRYDDTPLEFLLSCPEPHAPALLRAIYRVKKLVTHPEHTGVFRFLDWLPVRRALPGAAGPVAFHSDSLGASLGLENLFIIFNGWWPEKGALMDTCTFKELEAQAVCGRILEGWRSSLVVSSAGNTARAFHSACSRYNVPALLVVPRLSLPMLWSTGETGGASGAAGTGQGPAGVRLAVLDGGADYADAVELGNGIAATDGYYPEGGAKNAARRDGMGTAVLAAVESCGRIPDHYFQAVGSGTGAIAAWEMNLRLLEDGRYGDGKMKLHLAQNTPFTPMTDAWEAGTRSLVPVVEGRRLSRLIRARVLGNRNPPYAIAGGLFDALTDTGGSMYRVTNREAREAGRMFEKLEGCDIDPAAEVAVASLQQAVRLGRIGPRDFVALNVTGGGHRRLRRDRRIAFLRPHATLTLKALHREGPGRAPALLKSALV